MSSVLTRLLVGLLLWSGSSFAGATVLVVGAVRQAALFTRALLLKGVLRP